MVRTTGQPRVLVATGDQRYDTTLASALADDGYEPLDQSERSLTKILEHRPDLAILGFGPATADDVCEITRRLRHRGDMVILLLEAGNSPEARVAALEAGADEVLRAPSCREVVAHAEVLLRRAGRLTSTVSQLGDLVVDHAAMTATLSGEVLDLTRTELELLGLLVRNPGRLVAQRQLFLEVWGRELNRHLLEVHMSSLRRKLDSHGSHLIKTVRGEGYVLATAVDVP